MSAFSRTGFDFVRVWKRLFCERFEARVEDFYVRFGTGDGRTGSRVPDFCLEQLVLYLRDFIRDGIGMRWTC